MLTEAERAALHKRYGGEEAAAEAYTKWEPTVDHPLFRKVQRFFRRIYERLTGHISEGRVLGDIHSGKVWERTGAAGAQGAEGARARVVTSGKPAREVTSRPPEKRAAPHSDAAVDAVMTKPLDRLSILNPRSVFRRLKETALYDAFDLLANPLGERLAREGGEAGKKLMATIRKAGDWGEVAAGRRLVKLVDARLGELDREQRFNLEDALEGRAKPKDAAVRQAFEAVRGITDEIAAEAAGLGVLVKDFSGRKTPFAGMRHYFPPFPPAPPRDWSSFR